MYVKVPIFPDTVWAIIAVSLFLVTVSSVTEMTGKERRQETFGLSDRIETLTKPVFLLWLLT